ncbi:hypothetical protein R4Y59_002745 [Enterococcus faecalis]|nr:hypothetical protein [Enterococcus faecalis]
MSRKNKLAFLLLFLGVFIFSGCSLVTQEVNDTINSGKNVINSGIQDGKKKVDNVVDSALGISDTSDTTSDTKQTTDSK